MKRFIAVALCLVLAFLSVEVISFAADAPKTYYVDPTLGNDNESGTSPEEAWKTLERAGDKTYMPGEKLLLKCGETFMIGRDFVTRGNGTQENPIMISTYGEGERPVITSRKLAVFFMPSVSNWIVENLEFTSPEGGCRLWMNSDTADAENITVRNCSIYDIGDDPEAYKNPGIKMSAGGNSYRMRNVRFENIEIYNMENGIYAAGTTYASDFNYIFASGWTFDGLNIHDIEETAIITECVEDLTIKNTHISNCKIGIESIGFDVSIYNNLKNRIHADDPAYEPALSQLFASGCVFDGLDIHDVENRAIDINCVNDLTVKNCRISNCEFGIESFGFNAESRTEWFVNPDESYQKNLLIEGCIIRNAKKGGIILGSLQDGTVRNCRILDCATSNEGAYAPAWMHHTTRSVFEYCEIAGSTNSLDGMTVDFDGWTTNCSYRYIYSHDNKKFMFSNTMDSANRNSGNSVYNCVSVNDKDRFNFASFQNTKYEKFATLTMKDFSFHDNIIVNGKPIIWIGTEKPKVENNIFKGNFFNNLIQRILNLFSSVDGFTYSADEGTVERAIAEITANLP